MLFGALVLESLLRTCAPNIGARTMTAIVRVESGGNALAIHDNTLDRAFGARNLTEAVSWAKQLIALNHSVDLGIAQINNSNLPRLGMSLREAFDPCSNLRGGATILGADYKDAATHFGPGQFALRRAIGAYNTGSLFAGSSYVARILEAAGIAADDDFRVPDIGPLDGAAPAQIAGAPRTFRVRAVARPRPPAPAVTQAPDPVPAPILIQVTHVDVAARQRAIVTAANGGVPPPAVSQRADDAPVVLHLAGQPEPSPAAVVTP